MPWIDQLLRRSSVHSADEWYTSSTLTQVSVLSARPALLSFLKKRSAVLKGCINTMTFFQEPGEKESKQRGKCNIRICGELDVHVLAPEHKLHTSLH